MAIVNDSTLHALRRKLEHWELLHLREHIEELRQQLDHATAELDALRSELRQVESWGEMWERTAQAYIDDDRAAGGAVGLTMDGSVVPLREVA